MLAKRTISAIVIIIICLALIIIGGWFFTIGVAAILAAAAWEYARIFEKGGYFPAKIILTVGTFLCAITGKLDDPLLNLLAFNLTILTIILYHVMTYKEHQSTAAFDLAASLAGVAFIAYIGLYLIKLRFLPNGLLWIIQCILPAGISDVGAFIIGSTLGSHKIAPELSPKKTVEGYIGGVLTSALVGTLAGLVFSTWNPNFSSLRGLLIGLAVGIICPLGDFAKSIFKRQFGLKNTGTLIPGHGGVLDRIDTWLIAGITSYLMILLFFI